MKVMIVVTHLLGTGHLSRALTLGRAFAKAGHSVQLISGGVPVPHLPLGSVDLVQLPPLRSDGVDFTRLLTPEGHVADEDYLANRRRVLCAALTGYGPDLLLTELFPFGRRSLAREFEALLQTATATKHRPVILSSIRDILAPPSKPAKAERADDLIGAYFDGVLVHSDPVVTKLEISWPVSKQLAEKLLYTGFVVPAAALPHPDQAGKGEILVSAGGGEVGTALYQCAIQTAKLIPEWRWRLLVGGNNAQGRIADLGPGPANLALEPARPDFRQMLNHAAASVSMCGYNTALDLLQAGTPGVLVPFDDGKEVEQTLRAESLSHLDGIAVIRSAELTPESLSAALTRVLNAPRRPKSVARFDGADRTVAIAEEMVKARR